MKRNSRTDEPQTIRASGGLSQRELLVELSGLLEDDGGPGITAQDERRLVNALRDLVAGELAEGRPINLFGIVTIQPRYHTAGRREVNVDFGDPDSGTRIKRYPAKVTVKATVSRRIKDATPGTRKMKELVGA